jgi:hypothetical protein
MFLYWTLEYTPHLSPPAPPIHPLIFLSLFSEILLKYSFHIEPDKRKGNCTFVCVCVCDIILLNKSRGKWRQSAVDFLLLFIIVWRMEMSSLIIHKLTGEVLPVDVTFWCCWRCTVFYKLQTLHLSALFCVNYGLQHSQLVAWQLAVLHSMAVNNYLSHES